MRINRSWVIPARELVWRFSRSGGPGGQGVNTTDSRVQLSWDVAHTSSLPPVLRQRALAQLDTQLTDGVLTITVSTQRSQWANRRSATQRLAHIIGHAIAPPTPPRRATQPSKGARKRRAQAKQHRSAIKEQRRRPEF